jgi:aminomethyltransferase
MSELQALLGEAGVAPLDGIGWLRVTGSDRVRWLNGMVTNSIQELKPGEGNYSFLLNAQGRIEGDLTAFALEDAVLLETGQPAAVAAHLDRFIIMDDVELEVLSPDRTGVVLAGPRASELLSVLGLPVPEPLAIVPARWQNSAVDLVAAYSPLVPRFELWGAPETVRGLIGELHARGVETAAPEALEQLRVLEGTPRYGVDIRNSEGAKDLPQETGQTRALHFNKGCYLGQEIVERIRSRGQVHRTFSGFLLEGALPEPGAALLADAAPGSKAVGELTSVARVQHPAAGVVELALGYVRREALERGQPIYYSGGTATPVSLPYRPA